MEEERHNQLLKFLEGFKLTIEEKLEKTNDKLDTKMEVLTEEVKEISGRLDKNEKDAGDMFKRMDERMSLLELKMRKSGERREEREALDRRHVEKAAEGENEKRKGEQEKRRRSEKEKASEKERVGRQYERRVIRQEELVKETPVRYKSTWATRMEKELATAAANGMADKDPLSTEDNILGIGLEGGAEDEEEAREEDETPDTWERLTRREDEDKERRRQGVRRNKVRSPPAVMNWMSDEPELTQLSSSDESQEEEGAGWNSIEREKGRTERNRT